MSTLGPKFLECKEEKVTPNIMMKSGASSVNDLERKEASHIDI